MTAFDQAWDVVKAEWGEGFRVHGFDLDAPAVTELVGLRRNLMADPGGYGWNMHDMSPSRGSGTGVSGTYYHGGPFDPFFSGQTKTQLENLMRWLEVNEKKGEENPMVYIPPPKNPIATTPKFRDFSMELLRNVMDESSSYGYPTNYTFSPRTPKASFRQGSFNAGLPRIAPAPKTFEERVDLMASPYTLDYGSYWGNTDDLINPEGDLKSLGGETLLQSNRNRLFDYLGRTPLVRGIMGSDIGDIDDLEYNWFNDPEVLQELNARMRDTGGLSPMNILLGEYGHDAVVPVNSRARGSSSGQREVTEGSVLIPTNPVEGWDIDYHPMESGAFEPLMPHHVGRFIDELDRTQEIVDETERGRKLAEMRRKRELGI